MPIPRSEPTRRLPSGRRREAILALLEDADRPLGVDELAGALGLHPNTVRAHLAVLVRTGAARRTAGAPGGRGRPRDLYAAAGVAPDGYAALADVLAARLAAVAPDVAAEAVAAGRAWADRLAAADAADAAPEGPEDDPLGAVVGVLEHLGFAPAVVGDEVRLHACPFRRLAAERPDVVCNAHLGLLQRTLERTAPGVRATAIHPFVAPTLCVARIAGA